MGRIRNHHNWLLTLLVTLGVMVCASSLGAYPLVKTVALQDEPHTDETVIVDVNVDLSGGSDQLGTYSFDITWDPTVLDYESITGGTTPGFETLNKNESGIDTGTLSVNHFYTTGAGDDVHVARLTFTAIGDGGSSSSIGINIQALNAAITFADLTGDIETSFCTVMITTYSGPVIESVVIDPNSGTIGPGQAVDITVTAEGNQVGLTPSDATFLGHQVPLFGQGNGTYTGSYTVAAGDQAQEFDSSALFTENFESGTLDQWYVDGSIILTDVAKHGSGGLATDVQGASITVLQERFDIPRNEFTVSYYFRLDPDFAMEDRDKTYVSLLTGSGGPLYALRLRKEGSDFQLNVTLGAFITDIGDWQTIEPGAWNWIKVHYLNATEGIAEWWVNGSPAGTYSGDTSGTPLTIFNALYMGGIPETMTGMLYLDHVQLTVGDHIEPGYPEATDITLTDDLYGLVSDPASSSGSTLIIDQGLTQAPIIESVVLSPNSGFVGVGDAVTITVTEANGLSGLTASPATFNDASITLTDQGNGSYSGVYTVAEGDPDASGMEATGIVLTNEYGSSFPGSSFGSTLFIDGTTPSIAQLTLDPSAGYLTTGDTVTITATAVGNETGLVPSTAMINGVAVTLAESGGGAYTGTYTVAAQHQQGSGLQATGITLTDAAGNSSTAASSAVSTLTVDTHVPVISSVTITPNTGTILIGDTITISVTEQSGETGLMPSDATVNGRTVSIAEVGNGLYRGMYTAESGDETGVVLEATGITLTDPAGNVSSEAASSGSTVIIALASITLLSPNGGEHIATGTIQPIVWDAQNIQTVQIAFSANSGQSWTTVAESVSAEDGSYQWQVQVDVSATCLIRVASTADSELKDTSDAVFETISIPTELVHHMVEVSNTGVNAVLLIPADSIPELDGTPAEIGDEIAVITPRGRIAGAGIWTGTNIAITVWGDDVNEDGVLGFQTGEAFSFGVWDASADLEYELAATYQSGMGTFMANGVNITASLFTLSPPDYLLPLKAGWNQISSAYLPGNTSMEAVMFPVRQSLIIVKSGAGDVYWPEFAVNQIGGWSHTAGYQLKLSAPDTLEIRGSLVAPDTVTYQLAEGWSLISYLGADGLSPETAFGDAVDSIFMVKDAGGLVYWPSYDIDQILAMSSDMGYWIKVTEPVTFSYPAGSAKIVVEHLPPATPAMFAVQPPTGVSATYLLEPDESDHVTTGLISAGDEIGIFDSADNCVGAGVWQGTRIAVTVWGDDVLTVEPDGLIAGEEMRMVLWDAETVSQHELTIQGDVRFEPHGSERITFTANTAGSEITAAGSPEAFTLLQNFPNPFNPVTTIEYAIPADSHVHLAVYSVSGQQIAVLKEGMLPAGRYSVTWNAVEHPSGVYFCRLRSNGAVQTTKLILLK